MSFPVTLLGFNFEEKSVNIFWVIKVCIGVPQTPKTSHATLVHLHYVTLNYCTTTTNYIQQNTAKSLPVHHEKMYCAIFPAIVQLLVFIYLYSIRFLPFQCVNTRGNCCLHRNEHQVWTCHALLIMLLFRFYFQIVQYVLPHTDLKSISIRTADILMSVLTALRLETHVY